MAERHARAGYFITNRGMMRGTVNRKATAAEEAGAFRFSEMVQRGTPATSDTLLRLLAEHMTKVPPDKDCDVPAGYTYLSQFIDHDLTLDATKLSQTMQPGLPALSGRSPTLDLDSVYGLGPTDRGSQRFYEADGIRLKLGRTKESGPPASPAALLPLDGFDLPRLGAMAPAPEEAKHAMIGDLRNDENLAVAQVHLAFMRFHNATVQRLAAKPVPSALLFEEARREVTLHYQWLIRYDFLPRVVAEDVLEDVFRNGRKVFEPDGAGQPTMPIEFSVAAYRFGHSMIRPGYDWNRFFNGRDDALAPGSLVNLFRFSGTSGNLSPEGDLNNPLEGSFDRLPSNWIADWTRLFNFAADAGEAGLAPKAPAGLNFARRIDTRLTDPLRELPFGSFGPRGGPPADPIEMNLAFRNLVRGRMVQLATAQEVANHFQKLDAATAVLTEDKLLRGSGDGVDLSDVKGALRDELVTATPLWFYVLREAEVLAGKMGAVGGRILAETFHRAMEGSFTSMLREPRWRPSGGRHPRGFGMVDLLLAAYPNTEDLRPLD